MTIATIAFLVAEVAYAGKDHRQAQPVGGFDDFRIALRAAGLDDGGGAGFGDFFDAIGKGKKASEAATVPFSGSWAFIAPILAESTRLICPAPTPTVWPSRA